VQLCFPEVQLCFILTWLKPGVNEKGGWSLWGGSPLQDGRVSVKAALFPQGAALFPEARFISFTPWLKPDDFITD
jgi:hypothetical protein